MLQSGILNPQVLHLLARIRHTNTLVIADWAFPFWPQVETIDLALTAGIPSIPDLLKLLQPNFKVGRIWQAEEFVTHNPADTVARFDAHFDALQGSPEVHRLPHPTFKTLVPAAIGLIRTGDNTPYGNVILESV
jgi:D-ribose pyranase